MDSNNKGLDELLRLKAIVEWQLSFAKDKEIINKKQERLKTLNAQIEKVKEQQKIINDNIL